MRLHTHKDVDGIVVCAAGIQVPVVGAVPLAGILHGVFAGVSGAQGLVLVGTQHALRLSAYFW